MEQAASQIQDSRDLAFSGLFFAMDFFVELDDRGTGRALECIGRNLAKPQACVDGWDGQLAGGNEQSAHRDIFEELAVGAIEEIAVADKESQRLGFGLDAL
jgi:hypothetical protein